MGIRTHWLQKHALQRVKTRKKRERKMVCMYVCVLERVRVRLLGVGDQSSRIENHEFKHIISVSIHDVIN
jgi:hypothetical protein